MCVLWVEGAVYYNLLNCDHWMKDIFPRVSVWLTGRGANLLPAADQPRSEAVCCMPPPALPFYLLITAQLSVKSKIQT